MADRRQHQQQKIADGARVMAAGQLHARLAAGKMADRAGIEKAVASGVDPMELNRRCGLFSADRIRLREARIVGHGPALGRRRKQKAAVVSA